MTPRKSVRSYKQRFDPRARFVARRGFTLFGASYKRGDPVDATELTKTKVRRLWDSNLIELVDDAKLPPVGATSAQIAQNERESFLEPRIAHAGGGWYTVTLHDVEERVHGRAAAVDLADKMKASAIAAKRSGEEAAAAEAR